MVKLSFLGAMNKVGSSGVLVDTGTENIVLDYGTDIQNEPPTYPYAFKEKADAAFLSHAHLDHSGGLALLQKRSACPIYAMPVSKPLVQMLLNDSLKISKSEGTPLPFDKGDVRKAIKSFKSTEYKKPIKIGRTKAVAYDAGHIPGSMMPFLKMENKRGYRSLLYTGDYNTKDTRLVKGCEKKLPEVDILITESTYYNRDHKIRAREEKRLVNNVNTTLANDGTVIISNFAISRTQEVMLILAKHGIDYPLYMDGMAKKATTIINSHPLSIRDPTSLDRALRKVQYVSNNNSRRRALKNPSVILTTSGMLNGGPVVWYLNKLHKDPKHMLMLTGFQVPGTPGHGLLETGRVLVDEHDWKLNMQFDRLDFSSHAGRKDMLAFIKKLNPKKIFCVHGDDTPTFAQELQGKGFDATAPIDKNRTFEL